MFGDKVRRGYIIDGNTIQIGRSRMRQVRSVPNTCKIPQIMRVAFNTNQSCNREFFITDEEQRDFGISWNLTSVSSDRVWNYENESITKTMYYFGKNLS